jgi:hypothetical protein
VKRVPTLALVVSAASLALVLVSLTVLIVGREEPEPGPAPPLPSPIPVSPTVQPTGVVPTPGTPTDASGLQAAIDAQLASLSEGGIAYGVAPEMPVGVESTALLRIARSPTEDLGQGAPVPVQIERVKVAPLMAAQLRGLSFEVVPAGREQQVVPPTGFAEWRWSIVPMSTGEQTLRFVVYVVLRLPEGDEKTFQIVKDKDVSVQVNVPYQLGRFIADYWPHISGVITALFGSGVVWTILSRRRKERDSKPA